MLFDALVVLHVCHRMTAEGLLIRFSFVYCNLQPAFAIIMQQSIGKATRHDNAYTAYHLFFNNTMIANWRWDARISADADNRDSRDEVWSGLHNNFFTILKWDPHVTWNDTINKCILNRKNKYASICKYMCLWGILMYTHNTYYICKDI